MIVTITTDGACSGNPGAGGWAALLRAGEHKRILKGGEAHTTNNRMELMAAIMALEALKRPSQVRLRTDSSYLKNGITQWMKAWQKNGWRTKDKKEVKNQDLWKRLNLVAQKHNITWVWVKGHAGDQDNEEVDGLAREESLKFG